MTTTFLPVKLKLLFAVLAIFFVNLCLFAQEKQPSSINTSPLPAPTGFVNDYAGVIDPATKQQLETKLRNLKESTKPSVEIAVAVVRTTGDRPIFEYSLAVARGWKIGSKEDDSPGALLLVAIDDRKYFTQVSRDLEDELPDGIAGSLQRQFLVPEFKKGNYGKGISDTINAYVATIKRQAVPVANRPANVYRPTPARGADPVLAGAAIFFAFLVLGMFGFFMIMFFTSVWNDLKNTDWTAPPGDGTESTTNATPWIGGGFGSSTSWSPPSSSFGGGGFRSGGSGFGGFGGGGGFSGGGAGGSW